MPDYIVTKVTRISADNEKQAVAEANARAADEIRVSPGAPPERLGYHQYYRQEIAVLDVAWDMYMDESLPSRQGERPMPSMLELGGKPYLISLLFDLAITAYRERFERRPNG